MWKRAILYITRKRTRSLLLFILIFVMVFSLLIGLSIKGSTSSAAEAIKKTTLTGIKLERVMVDAHAIYDFKKNEKNEIVRTYKLPLLKESILEDVLKIEGVCGYHREIDPLALYTGFKNHPGLSAGMLENSDKYETKLSDEEWESCRISTLSARFYLVETGAFHPYFMNGALEIAEGRNIEEGDENAVVISQEYAKMNNLHIGDLFEARNYNFITGEIYGAPFSFKVVGIFKMNFEQQVTELTDEQELLTNSMFTNQEQEQFYFKNWYEYYNDPYILPLEDPLISEVILYVEDPDILSQIEDEIRNIDKVDWEYYEISYYDQDYKAVAQPLITMMNLTRVGVLIVLIGILLILFLVLSMWIRGRKREFDILHYIGIKKTQVWGQLMLESGLLSLMAFLAAYLLTHFTITGIGDFLLQLLSPQNTGQAYTAKSNNYMEVIVSRVPVKPTDLIYNLSSETVLIVLGIVLAVVLISVTIAFFRNSRKS